jgi:hypothetical protein
MTGHTTAARCAIQPIIPFVQSRPLIYSKVNQVVPKIKPVLIPEIGRPIKDTKVANAGFFLPFL